MRSLLLLLLTVHGLLPGRSNSPAAEGGLASMLTKVQYERLFPHHHPLYSYEGLIKAAAGFPGFAAEGDITARRRELSAFFAEIAHETTNGGPGAPGGGEWSLN